jgi:hypothetical protein
MIPISEIQKTMLSLSTMTNQSTILVIEEESISDISKLTIPFTKGRAIELDSIKHDYMLHKAHKKPNKGIKLGSYSSKNKNKTRC